MCVCVEMLLTSLWFFLCSPVTWDKGREGREKSKRGWEGVREWGGGGGGGH